MIEAASDQLGELIDELSLAADESGRYDPKLERVSTDDLAAAAVERLGDDRVSVSGKGEAVLVDVETAKRSVSALVQCALRHGGLEQVDVVVAGPELRSRRSRRRRPPWCSARTCATSAPRWRSCTSSGSAGPSR